MAEPSAPVLTTAPASDAGPAVAVPFDVAQLSDTGSLSGYRIDTRNDSTEVPLSPSSAVADPIETTGTAWSSVMVTVPSTGPVTVPIGASLEFTSTVNDCGGSGLLSLVIGMVTGAEVNWPAGMLTIWFVSAV